LCLNLPCLFTARAIKIVDGDIHMSKRLLTLAVLLMAAILVSGCCCCATGDRGLYSPGAPEIRASPTPIIVTVPVTNVTPTVMPTATVMPVVNVTPTVMPTITVVSP
jgi:hypothetical protein